MTDAEYFETLRAAAEDGDQQAAEVLRMLESRFMLAPGQGLPGSKTRA